jgi:hypothetical protein
MFMHGSLLWFLSSRQQLSAPWAICSKLTVSSLAHGRATVYFCMTPMWNTNLLESVGENFDVNFVMKEFPADKQFIIWQINLELDSFNREQNIRVECLLWRSDPCDFFSSGVVWRTKFTAVSLERMNSWKKTFLGRFQIFLERTFRM